ncbi:serine hydrolase [Streptomyces californicus]|uniref:D-alanyl-D-alanine carboxypeptidase family protein n=1 Tax=Streptomyces californicus TaxID=67351 RepID=UPI0036FAC77C
MAGESPDKTEQRKSSSGTAAEERDPRFAVFRDPGEAADEAETEGADADAGSDADAGTGTGAGSGATSDTATAVFRPRLPEDGPRRESKPEPKPEPKAEPEPEPKADAKPVAKAEAVSGGEASAAPENASEAGSDAGNGREGELEAAREPESAPEAASTASEGAGEAEEPAKAPEAARGGASPKTGEKAADAGKADAGKSDAEKSDAETSGAESAEAADAADVADGSEAAAPAKGEACGDEPEAADGDGRLRAAVAAWVDADAGADADAETGEKPKPESTSKAEKPGKAEKAEQGKSTEREKRAGQDERDGEPEPAAKPVPAGRSTADSGSDKDTDTDTDAAPDSGADADGDSAADSGGGSDLRGIDQPTAVFKAVKPGAKGTGGVDQATTALKLPRDFGTGTKPAAKPEAGQPKGKSAAEPGTEPESDAERTSTFVPLRSDDVRTPTAPRKPEAGSTAGAAGAATGVDAGTGTPARTPEAGAPAPAAPSWAAAERTRQQPLPPKPPLDLLAELTNTPPPPETPVRTAVRRVKIWTPLVLLLLIVFAIVQVTRPLPEPSLELTAKPTYTFEGGETKLSWPGQGQSAVMVDGVGSLGTEGPQKPAPIASVAKVMTAYVILREHPLKGDEEGEKITVDQKAEDESKRPDESTAPLTKGQKLSQRQMLQLLMIPSGNNAARLLARWDAGSEDAFIDKMNDAAKDLGMKGSTYTDPSGLEKTTVSTATDQLKLAQAVMRNEVFRKIVDMPEVEIEGIDGKIYNNNNLLLQPGVSGIKTGSSTPAGGNLLWSANTKVDGKMLWIYGAVMGQQAGTGRVYDSLELSLQNSLKLIKDAQKAATSATVLKKGDVVGYVDNGFGGKTPVVATKSLKAVGWSGLEVELKVTDNGEGIDPAAKAGSEVGMVTVGTGTGKMTAPVVLQDDLAQPAFGDKLTRIG